MNSTRPVRNAGLPVGPGPEKKRARRTLPAWAVVALAVGAAVLLARTFRLAVVRGHSMEPSLKQGDYLVTQTVSSEVGKIGRFDLITFTCPQLGGREVVKRVIALPGETVEICTGKVYVNGEALGEPFPRAQGFARWGPAKVQEGFYFVLGDNRVASIDSTVWGAIPASSITGVVCAKLSPGGDK